MPGKDTREAALLGDRLESGTILHPPALGTLSLAAQPPPDPRVLMRARRGPQLSVDPANQTAMEKALCFKAFVSETFTIVWGSRGFLPPNEIFASAGDRKSVV